VPDPVKPSWFRCSKCKQMFQTDGGPGRPACAKCGAPPDAVEPAQPASILSVDDPPDGVETEDMLIALIYKLLCTEIPAGKMIQTIDGLRMERFNGGGKVRLGGFFFAQHCNWLAKRLRG